MERSAQSEGSSYEQQVAPGQLPKRLDESVAPRYDVAALADTTEALAESSAEDDHADERDDFPWDDAARWHPGDRDDCQLDERHLDSEALDELFGEQPDEAIGSVDELGWFGLIHHEGRPGGLLLGQDQLGFRRVWEAESDDALQQRWSAIQEEHERFYEERDAYERATGSAEVADCSGPRIWIGSLADYAAGRLHGVWFDATCEADDLYAATRFMLRGSREIGAEEWGIFDFDGFYDCRLGEYESLTKVSRIAQGIAEHGEAFAAWVTCVDERDEDSLSADRFREYYLGEFESLEAYVEQWLEECGDYHCLEGLPEHLRPYVKIDIEQMARDYESDLSIVGASGGRVYVFNI